MKKQAIIIGATGLVGQELIKELTALYQKVLVIARRPPQTMSANMHFYQVNDFANLGKIFDSIYLGSPTDAFSCLGTTKKQAGSKEGFYKVDFEYNLKFAQCCHDNGIDNFLLLSAMGADADSRFFYNQVKGELEQAVEQIGFDNLYIFRPSLLLGKHKGRTLENLSQNVFRLISPVVSENVPAHPISGKRVAIAMAMTAHQLYEDSKYRQMATTKQTVIIENKQMLAMTKV